MSSQISFPAATHDVSIATEMSKTKQLMGALLLWLVMLYGVGFVQTAEMHNTAHDARHSVGFPCH